MKTLILAGGSGTRLWPLSRKNYPKQFLKINGNSSLLKQTAERLLKVVSTQDVIVMTNNEYKFYVKSELNDFENIILEPVSRNTAPAIALGIKYCMEKLGCREDEIIFISPSDHVIKPLDKFVEYVGIAEEIAKQGYIVTFGIKPERPETGYGYIKAGKSIGMGGYKAEEFTEKPDSETVKRYLAGGNYFWNSGMFSFSIGTMLREFSKHTPTIKEMLNGSFDDMIAGFSEMPDISIDYGVGEKSEKVAILPMDIYWNDIGSWDSLYEILDKDEMGNVKKGDVIAIDTKDTLIMGNKRLISTIGLEDCLIVETDDAILVSKKGETQRVKEVVMRLNESGSKEAVEHLTVYRPWGSYTILEEGQRYKIKRIIVSPCEKISLQMHRHRSEHWVVVKGTAKVTMGDAQMVIHENESVYVPKSTLHRLENPAEMPLEIIEVQNGEYVGEDDIVRYDDIYGR